MAAPPPVPPRPGEVSATQQYSALSPYNQRFGLGMGMGMGLGMGMGSPYGMSPYQPYGSAYGAYGSGYGMAGGFSGLAPGGVGFGMPQEVDFVRAAEESSRRAFQSIESIVHAFSSVSMLMESTYFAVHSSFRAVLGVAEHMARLKHLMTSILASLTIMKTIKRFLQRVLQMFRLIDVNDTNELAWSESLDHSITNGAAMHQSLRGLWPIFMFLSVITGTPWLIYKLMMSDEGKTQDQPSGQDTTRWAQQDGFHYLAVAKFPFQTNMANELTLSANEKIIVAPAHAQPKVQGWLLASRMDGKTIGLVPANYIEIESVKSALNDNK